MRIHAVFLAVVAVVATLGLVVAQDPPARQPAAVSPGGIQTPVPPEREPDARAIRDLLASFVKAYNEKDAKALGALFTQDAEIEDEDGEVTRGRDAIVGRFAGVFKESGGDRLAVDADSLRFLGTNIAIEEGTASIATGADTPPRTNPYSVIYARQEGRWLHARIRDEEPDEVSPHEQLVQLEWMVGEWLNESDDGIVKTRCTWSDDGNFLLREFDVKVEGRIALRGTRRIGWDAQRKQFRMWVFDDRGGFADGLFSRDGERWITKASGVRSDGRSVSTTNAFTPVGKDRILWETLERSIGGEVVPGTDQYYLVPPAPRPASEIPRSAIRRTREAPAQSLRRWLMTSRIRRRPIIVIILAFATAVQVVPADGGGGRGGGGRGGGGRGGGGRAGGGGGGSRGGAGGFSGGMPRGGGGGGFSRSPSISSPRPSPRPSPAGGRPGGGRPGGPQLGGGRPSTQPSRPQVGGRPGGPGSGPGNRPGGIGNRPGVDNRPGGVGGIGNRPGIDNRPGGVGGIGNRPGIDNRPGGIGGIGNRPGIDNRPGGVGGIGNRPGIDNRPGGVGGIGNRPGIDNRPGGVGGIGNRPGIDNRPGGVGGIGNRPGIDNRPGGVGGIGNRPGIDNRPIIGSGNTINRGDVNVGGIRQNNLAGVGVDPGYRVRPPAYNNWRGAYWGYHQGWANGYWHGYHNNNYWGWGSFGLGAAAGLTAWALGSTFYNWGYASYANPYYAAGVVAQPIVIEQTVAGGEPQTVTVPGYAYDYGQPIDTQSTPPPAEVADPAIAKFDSARAAFGNGDYAGALRLNDEALKVLPNDATLHEFRALVLFAVGKYELAAGPLYAVLSVGPGWDWTTMAGLYPDVELYTGQLRKLEAFVNANPASTAARFVLAYHYLTQGNTDAAVVQFKGVVALAPQDTLSTQLVKQFSPQAAAPETPTAPNAAPPVTTPAKQGNLTGNWTARPAPDTTIDLRIGDDSTFTWGVTAKGKPRRLAGKWSLADDMLTLADQGQGGAMVGHITWQAGDKWTFRAMGTRPEDQGLIFSH